IRDTAEAVQLARDVDPATFTRRTGKPPTNQYALTKHHWLTTHVPASRAAVRRFNVAEWVARGLGAEEACERSLASRTGWLDIAPLADPPHGNGGAWRAAIEAETRGAAERMATIAGIVGPHRRLVVTGGWCASTAVLAAKRRLFGPLTVADAIETGTLGAATL